MSAGSVTGPVEVQDLGRSIDYLETRPVIDTDELAYYGYRWGGLRGPIMLTLEPRFDVGVLLVAGFWDVRMLPEADEVTYTPRAKRHFISEGGHFVPRTELIRESLDWLDRYLGEVR